LKKLEHLSEIYSSYETFVIDLWGVIHNGIILNTKAIEVIENLSKNSKKIVFLSNAPRPSEQVKEFLKKLKMEERLLKHVVTSGEAAMKAINENRFGKFFYHLGPSRDDSIFYKVKNNKTDLKSSDFILCTGLFNDQEEDLNYYKDLLKNSISKKLICTNPDLIVHRGEKKEYCAGSIAKIFETLGGRAIYFGKPYKEIYKMCFNDKEKVLAIGDNLRTDIKGANNLNIDSIFISNGVHRDEFKNNIELDNLFNKYKVTANYYQPELIW
jgi:HAD superfamily hydrolase (TIGR01459 family)